MTFDLKQLPADPALLQQMLVDLLATLHGKERLIEQLQHQLSVLKRNHFGRKAETLDTHQLQLLFMQLQELAGSQAPVAASPLPEPALPEPAPVTRAGHGRQRLPAKLPRYSQEHVLPATERPCPDCGHERARIGEETTEQLDYRPASFFVTRHVRIKYACQHCQSQVVLSPLPGQAIEKGLPGPGLLAQVIVSKYADHLPLYRQEQIFQRHGIDLARSTLCDWVGACAGELTPLVMAMKREILLSKVIHTDDTVIPVQDDEREQTRQGRLWVYVGDRDHPYTVFDYTPTRGRDGPKLFLTGYHGHLQADAFAGYDGIYAPGDVHEVACWAHARRKFYDAQETDRERCVTALAHIRLLYDVEEKARPLDDGARKTLRQKESRPLLARLEAWLKEQSINVLPKSPLGQAIAYTLNHWAALNCYTDEGYLAIDNNAAERALRRVALGRKNWLFAGSDNGAAWAATIYSLIDTCQRQHVEPWAYFQDVLSRLPTHPARLIHELFPDHWQTQRTASTTKVNA